jgi:hypothetical protein
MDSREATARLHALLRALQAERRGQSAERGQRSIEAACLAILALRNDPPADLKLALQAVEDLQNQDGSVTRWKSKSRVSGVSPKMP